MPPETDLPKSPVTGNDCVKIVDRFAVADIVRLYKQQENIDVSGYLSHGDTVYLMECGDTGYRFYYPFEIAGDEAFYQELGNLAAKRGLEYDRDWSPDHEFAVRYIEHNERVLEIGCNTGKFLESIASKTKNVSGLEFNLIAVEAAIQKGLDVKNIDIALLAGEYPESYDVVCAFQVLEHITAIKPFIEACVKILRPGGRLILSVPNNEPYFQRFSKYEVLNLPPHHLGLWNLMAFEKFQFLFNIELEGHEFTGRSGLAADSYLRAKKMAGLMGSNDWHHNIDTLKLLLFLPLALMKSTLDLIKGKLNNAHVSVVFRKGNQKV